MEAKPICIIYLPDNFSFGNERHNAPMELMQALNANFGIEDGTNDIKYTEFWKEYYWFSFYKPQITEPEFKVFYSKDFTEIQFQELKQLIEDSIKEIKK